MMRGERKARAMLGHAERVGLHLTAVTQAGGISIRLPDDITELQKPVAADLALFAVAYPGCFRTLARLVEGGER